MRQSWLRLALIACAMRAMPLAAQSSMAAPPSKAEPRAELRSNALGDPQVVMFKPSYVAVFEVVPYGGIAQLYPLSAAEGAELVKDEMLTLSESRTREARRASARGVRLVAGGMGTNVGSPGRTRASGLRPRSMVLLASDRPFRVGSPDVTLGQLAMQMTGLRVPRVFVGEDEDIEKLVARVRPLSSEADITVDVLALPPDASEVSSAGPDGVEWVAEAGAGCGVANLALSEDLASKMFCGVSAPASGVALGADHDRMTTVAVDEGLVRGGRPVTRPEPVRPAPAPAPAPAPVAPAPTTSPAPISPKHEAPSASASRERPVP